MVDENPFYCFTSIARIRPTIYARKAAIPPINNVLKPDLNKDFSTTFPLMHPIRKKSNTSKNY